MRIHSASRVFLVPILSMTFFARVNAMNLKKCGEEVEAAQQSAQNGTNSITTTGLHLSRKQCIAQCGGGLGNINWGDFSQDFGAWFLPWISLAFQIPFGGESTSEDIQNFFMTIGSPALAAYSLQITHLNTRWLYKEVSNLEYPNAKAIAAVISAFQHVPIQISPSGASVPSLIVLRQNDQYWEHLLKGVVRTRRWSKPLFVGFVWVILAAILTIADAFASPPTDSVEYSIVAAWTFLLPIIMGWLYLGSQCEPKQLKEGLSDANKIAWVAGDQKNAPTRKEDATHIWREGIGFMEEVGADDPRKDELIAVPVFNYTRAFVWSLYAQHISSLVRNAAESAEQKIPVDDTKVQVTKYCTEAREPSEKALEPPPTTPSPTPTFGFSPNSSDAVLPVFHQFIGHSRWAPGIWGRTALAAFSALVLQWGTVGAAVSIHYWQPPIGLGCRTLSFLLYGATGTISMFLCLAGSILTHISRPLDGPWRSPPRFSRWLNKGALFCIYSGKVFAFISGIGIIIICSFHSSGVYNNCTCASTTFDRGVYDVVILAVDEVVGRKTIKVWIVELTVAFTTAGLFWASIYVFAPKRG